MSERNNDDAAQNPSASDGVSPSRAGAQDLPATDSPPLSPGGASSETEPERHGGDLIAWTAPVAQRRFRLRPRHKRRAVLAASIAIAAVLGAAAGGFAVRRVAGGERQSVVIREENKAMAQSTAHLAKQVAGLKANLSDVKKAAHAQFAKLADQVKRAPARVSEVTGSIPAPAKQMPAKPTPAESTAAVVPLPRPAPHLAAAGAPPAIAAAESRPSVVPSWRVRGMHRGHLYVEGHGDVFRVALGAVLPELGRVEAIRRQNGRWVVVTPKGLIVSRRFVERFPGRPPWYGPDF
jgi:hypothetical protein